MRVRHGAVVVPGKPERDLVEINFEQEADEIRKWAESVAIDPSTREIASGWRGDTYYSLVKWDE